MGKQKFAGKTITYYTIMKRRTYHQLGYIFFHDNIPNTMKPYMEQFEEKYIVYVDMQ